MWTAEISHVHLWERKVLLRLSSIHDGWTNPLPYKENTMQQTAPSTDTIRHSSRITFIGILALVALYVVSAYFGIPQRGRDLLVASHAAHDDHNSSNTEYPPTNDGEYANNSGIHPEKHVQNHGELTETGTPPPARSTRPTSRTACCA